MVGKSVTVNLADGLKNGMQALIGMSMMIHVSPHLSFVLISMMAPISIAAVVYGRYIKKLSKETQQSLADSMKIAEEKFAQIRTVKAFCRENQEIQK